jgi:hypothetical protein
MFLHSKYNLKNVHRDNYQLHLSKIFQINSRLNLFTNDHRPLSPITGQRIIKKANSTLNQYSSSPSNCWQLTEQNDDESRRLLEYERQHRKKVLKSFIPILNQNLYIIDRLLNMKSVKRMNDDFIRQTTKEVTVQRYLNLSKMNLK